MAQVSIVMPAHNSAQFIGQAIKSILAQSFEDWELIVVNDGSVDDTAQIVLQFNDPRIKHFYQAGQERSAARNTGVQMTQGECIAFLDADDFWLPEYLECQVSVLRKFPEVGLSFTWTYVTDPEGKPIRVSGYGESGIQDRTSFLRAMLLGNRMSSGAVIVRRVALNRVGLFDPEVSQGEDWDLWLRVAMQYPVAVVTLPLFCYRRYNTFMLTKLSDRGAEDAYLHILDKAFGLLTDQNLLQGKPEALGRVWWQGAWIRFVLGDVSEGQRRMLQARRIYPQLFEPPYAQFVEIVSYLADELYDLITPLDEAVRCIRKLKDSLPDWARPLQPACLTSIGHYAGLHIFRAYELRNRSEVARAAILVLKYQPAQLLNRGICAIILKAILGTGRFSGKSRNDGNLLPLLAPLVS
jgi:Glycosyl transferase family 2